MIASVVMRTCTHIHYVEGCVSEYMTLFIELLGDSGYAYSMQLINKNIKGKSHNKFCVCTSHNLNNLKTIM